MRQPVRKGGSGKTRAATEPVQGVLLENTIKHEAGGRGGDTGASGGNNTTTTKDGPGSGGSSISSSTHAGSLKGKEGKRGRAKEGGGASGVEGDGEAGQKAGSASATISIPSPIS